jgi:hypothetical protein
VDDVVRSVVFEANITHNLNKMADAAGVYKARKMYPNALIYTDR